VSPSGGSKSKGRDTAQRRRAEAEARRRKQRMQRTVGGIVVAVVLVALVLAAVGGGGDDGDGDDTADTADTADGSETTEPDSTPTEGATDLAEPECPGPEKPSQRPAGFTGAPPDCLTDGVDYSAVMVTSQGEITFDLLEDEAPATVNSFVFLARWGWYDGDDFHRVIQGFMNQGGDPIAEGTGGPGYTFPDELPSSVEEYVPGTVAMANSGPDTNGSQFFMCVGCDQLPTPGYSIFGQVTAGLDVVEAINALGAPPGQSGPPSPPVTIESVTIVEA
jgi:cyclophilin family peptidyl-prolyl cis-trans isomerase